MARAEAVLIPDGEHELALRVARCLAQSQRFETHVLSTERCAPLRFSRHNRGFHLHHNHLGDDSRVQGIRDTAKKIGAKVILPVSLPIIRLVAHHRDELAQVASLPPLPSPSLLDTFADKLLLADLLERAQIPHPRTHRLTTHHIDQGQLRQMRLPLLVKARRRSAGEGLYLCRDAYEVIKLVTRLHDPSEFIIQEFVHGPDVDVSVLCRDGEILAYTMQRALVPSHKPWHPAAAIEFMYDREAFTNIERLVRAVRWSGIAHFDCIFDHAARQTLILEVNPRYWRSLLGSLNAGVNFPHLACLASQGQSFERPAYRHIRYAKPETALRMWLGGILTRGSPRWRLRDSSLSTTATDPLPDLAIQAKRLIRTLSSLKKASPAYSSEYCPTSQRDPKTDAMR